MMTSRGTQPTTNAFRYLIITSLISYKNNILYYLSTHETDFVTMPEKKRQEFCLKLTAQDMWGQIFQDKYHEEKKRETNGMSLCLNAHSAYSKAKIGFVHKTL